MSYILQEKESGKYICARSNEDEYNILYAKIYDDYTTAILHKESWNRFMKSDFMKVIEVDKQVIQQEWDAHFLQLAKEVSEHATCKRLKVGCVITSNNEIVSTGCNQAPIGKEQCEDADCLINDQGRCIRTIHAEQNAILNIMPAKGDLTLYVTHYPCENCSKFIVQKGIKRVVYLEPYENKYSEYFLDGLEVCHFEGGKE